MKISSLDPQLAKVMVVGEELYHRPTQDSNLEPPGS